MDIVLREAERLNSIIRSFLAYARPQRFAVARLDVRRALNDAAALLRNSADVNDKHVIEVVVPPYELQTSKARAVLPKKFSKEDTVFNLQKLGLLIAAVTTGDEDAMKAALVDRLHEPYREALVPELGSLRRELRGSAALGCVLSGAGPSILVPFNRRNRNAVVESLENWAKRQESKPQILDLQVDREGLRRI